MGLLNVNNGDISKVVKLENLKFRESFRYFFDLNKKVYISLRCGDDCEQGDDLFGTLEFKGGDVEYISY